MKRVIVKSVVITLCLMLISIAVGVAVITAHFPEVVANLAFRVQSKETCVSYSEKAYEKKGDIESLALLTERCIWAENDEKIVIYAEKLISHAGFSEYSEGKDSGYAYYIASEYSIALYDIGETDKSIESAFQNSKGFKTVGPVHRMIAYVLSKNDETSARKIASKLETYNDEYAAYLITVINDALS